MCLGPFLHIFSCPHNPKELILGISHFHCSVMWANSHCNSRWNSGLKALTLILNYKVWIGRCCFCSLKEVYGIAEDILYSVAKQHNKNKNNTFENGLNVQDAILLLKPSKTAPVTWDCIRNHIKDALQRKTCISGINYIVYCFQRSNVKRKNKFWTRTWGRGVSYNDTNKWISKLPLLHSVQACELSSLLTVV